MAGMDPVSAVLGGGFELVGNWMSNSAAMERQKEAEQFNAQQAGIARDFNASEAAIGRDFSAGQADINRAFSGNEAEKQRQFQNVMSSTAYQRATADMRKAGINPMVAYMQGGASTPAGAAGQPSGAAASTASAPGFPSIGPAQGKGMLDHVLSSAFEAAKVTPQIRGIEASAEREEQAAKTEQHRQPVLSQEAKQREAETRLTEKNTEVAEQERKRKAAETKEIGFRHGNISAGGVSLNAPYVGEKIVEGVKSGWDFIKGAPSSAKHIFDLYAPDWMRK